VTDRDYYTNSFHIPVYFPISAFDKIRLEAPYHALTNGGHISYIELDGDPTQNIEAFEQVIRYMKECGIGYGSINHPVDRDPICGYTGIIGDVCPRCGRREGEAVRVGDLRRLGLYKNLNLWTLGYHGAEEEEKDRLPNELKRVK
jgi:ribonucleoside-triphosphate reductase